MNFYLENPPADNLAEIIEKFDQNNCDISQEVLVRCCKKLLASNETRRKKLRLLAMFQKKMRDPERTLVCDILANGQLLPDPNGERYGFNPEDVRNNSKKED